MPSKEQWAEAKRWYVEGEVTPQGRRWPTLAEIGQRLGVTPQAVCLRVKREGWQELRRVCQLQLDQGVKKQLEDSSVSVEVAEFNVDGFRAAWALVKLVKARAENEGSNLSAKEVASLSDGLKAAIQTGRLTMGQSTENIETDVTQALLEAFSRRKRDGGQG